jgi:hypothetical protein
VIVVVSHTWCYENAVCDGEIAVVWFLIKESQLLS